MIQRIASKWKLSPTTYEPRGQVEKVGYERGLSRRDLLYFLPRSDRVVT